MQQVEEWDVTALEPKLYTCNTQ